MGIKGIEDDCHNISLLLVIIKKRKNQSKKSHLFKKCVPLHHQVQYDNMLDPLISVIVLVYNVEKYLHRCLDSIIHQTYTNIEILIVDDGSTDHSGIICDEYAGNDSRIKLIHQSNQGLSAARNAGLDIATGDYIMFVDSDDWVEPSFCETPLLLALQHQVELVNFSYRYMPMNRILKPDKTKVITSEEHIKHLILNDEITLKNYVWNKFYSRRLFQSVRFPVGKLCEDNICYIPIHLARRTYISDAILYNYTHNRPESLTSPFNWCKSGTRYDLFEIRKDRLAFISTHYPHLTEIHILQQMKDIKDSVLHFNIRHKDDRRVYNKMLDFLCEHRELVLSQPYDRRMYYYVKHRWIAMIYDYLRPKRIKNVNLIPN